jgi:adenine-specific DNA methylase
VENLSDNVHKGGVEEDVVKKAPPSKAILDEGVKKAAENHDIAPMPVDKNFSRMAAMKSQIKPLSMKLARRAARQAARRAMRQFLPAGVSAGMRYVGPAAGVYGAFVMAAKSKAFNPP